ncbi:RNA polymerase sigma factor [Flavivirga sp. 57AJ16]|uniref:RNA polymerase sigma factor n=1 Tax=Flavivirga sp. 57AJ16 TaxID=3025307 RepID=UPI0023656463|nr:sigma-70 family RNA polymerase sigma factor [Flavivirga sp. 57AJ16]MDD7887725.1 sigma-70 family RNA polymerase sigma factor [Flavivirga sp. 57AJ16]
MLKSYSDKELLEQISLGNSHAFRELHYRYSAKMFTYGFNVLRNKEICEDLVQNIFIDFWTKRKNNKIKNIKSYLFGAVKYQLFNYFRDQKMTYEDITRLNIIDVSIGVSKEMEYQELEEAIRTSFCKLPNRCKEIFELSRYQNKSHKEISEELEISIQAVKNQISKAISSIKKDLHKHGYVISVIFILAILK